MNLIFDLWLQAFDSKGAITKISPLEITNLHWSDIHAPRPDFKGSIYQFLIGLLQTCSPPSHLREWNKWRLTPPAQEKLKENLIPYKDIFELHNPQGPAFMQDFALENAERCPIANLLIDSPGENTIKENRDLFIERGRIEKLCPACAAMALFTLQINAPSGGQGHRTSVRGGGPLTTLIVPTNPKSSLWERLIFNLLPKDREGDEFPDRKSIFPWLSPTRVSESKSAVTIPLEHAHELQTYWSMPRRIRLDFDHLKTGRCDLCGDQSSELISQYYCKNYGINYTGCWIHSLTPYKMNKDEPPISFKGQRGGVCYRHWLGLALGDDKGEKPAHIVKHYGDKLDQMREISHEPQLWCFGYDMDKMKARCWYENTLPLFNFDVQNQDSVNEIKNTVRELVEISHESFKLLKKCLKAALYGGQYPSKKIELIFIGNEFWGKSESSFYKKIKEIHRRIDCDGKLTENHRLEIVKDWLKEIKQLTLALFDSHALAATPENLNLEKIIPVRKYLLKWLRLSEPMNVLWKEIKKYQIKGVSYES